MNMPEQTYWLMVDHPAQVRLAARWAALCDRLQARQDATSDPALSDRLDVLIGRALDRAELHAARLGADHWDVREYLTVHPTWTLFPAAPMFPALPTPAPLPAYAAA